MEHNFWKRIQEYNLPFLHFSIKWNATATPKIINSEKTSMGIQLLVWYRYVFEIIARASEQVFWTSSRFYIVWISSRTNMSPVLDPGLGSVSFPGLISVPDTVWVQHRSFDFLKFNISFRIRNAFSISSSTRKYAYKLQGYGMSLGLL